MVVHALWSLLRWSAVSSLRATALAVVVSLVAAIGRRSLRPGWIYALWLLVFLQLALPRVPANPINAYSVLPQPASVSALAWVDQAIVGEGATPLPGTASETRANTPSPSGSTKGTSGVSGVKPDGPALPAWQLMLVSLWLAGVAFLTGRVTVGERRLRRKLRRALPVTDPRVLSVWNERLEEVGRTRRPSLVETDSIPGPALVGVIRPRVLLPTGMAAQLTDQELRHVFAHELVHNQRWDLAASWAAVSLEILHWFNPLVWWSSAQMTEAQELACDAAAVGRGAWRAATEYGHTLIRVMELARAPDPRLPGVAGMTRHGSLNRKRIQMIRGLRKPEGTSAKVLAVISVLIVSTAAGCASATGPTVGSTTQPNAVASSSTSSGAAVDVKNTAYGYSVPIPAGWHASGYDGLPTHRTAELIMTPPTAINEDIMIVVCKRGTACPNPNQGSGFQMVSKTTASNGILVGGFAASRYAETWSTGSGTRVWRQEHTIVSRAGFTYDISMDLLMGVTTPPMAYTTVLHGWHWLSSTAGSRTTRSSSAETTGSSPSTHPAFAGTAYRSQSCISSAKVPPPVLHPSAASVVDCWKGTLDGHDFTLIIWDKYQSQGYTYSSRTKTKSYPVGNIQVYSFSGDYACYVQGAVNGGVINLTNGQSASDGTSNTSEWSGCDRNPTKGVTGLPTSYPLRP